MLTRPPSLVELFLLTKITENVNNKNRILLLFTCSLLKTSHRKKGRNEK